MKSAVSLPDQLFEQAEAEAKRLGISRSKLHQLALELFLQRQSDAAFTQKVNEAVARDRDLGPEDEGLLEHNRRNFAEILKDDQW